jgi:membrane-associated phospholipid phosphatase
MIVSYPAAVCLEQKGSRPSAIGATPIYLFLTLIWSLMPLALGASGLHIALDEFGMAGTIFAFGLWLSWCLRARGFARIATAIEACILLNVICITICLLTFVAGAIPSPFFDASLACADRILLPGLDWPKAMLSFSASGLPVIIANWVYESISWQPLLLIMTYCLLAAYQRVWSFLLSWIATLSIVAVIFALYPALGAYEYFGIVAADVPGVLDPTPWTQPLLLYALKSGTLKLISLGTLEGIVNYPSFHAGAAVLLAYGFWRIRFIRWPFRCLNALMLASAVPIGGHYIVDLVAGVLAAAAGIGISALIASFSTRVIGGARSAIYLASCRPS